MGSPEWNIFGFLNAHWTISDTSSCDIVWLGKLNVLLSLLHSEVAFGFTLVHDVSTLLTRFSFAPPVKTVFDV